MTIAISLVVITLIASLIGTILLTGKSDENYETAARSNTLRLTAIYAVVIFLSLGALAWFIRSL
ncbi:hypothetical protein [Bacillus sp. T33-2]|uniref:hypothetical protein n=1 Tax=Bacillus sp. T33-2 TaxID=2054168 RepID=UPI000C77857A|nr:hypothetical protein [Bacillus sp. T33-2]PLR92844.1 hypothetical protein CVD19_19820 [Bacillus sp. T33-2]